ncbi:hypothetical protein [Pedobacter sp.]|uniref:hypothetical protein n=1 Tax=Pedobacter sp. TaxID=1411316 RepID=UPI003BAA6C4B
MKNIFFTALLFLAYSSHLFAQKIKIDTIRQTIVFIHCAVITPDDTSSRIDYREKDFIWSLKNKADLESKKYLEAIKGNPENSLYIFDEDLLVYNGVEITRLGLEFIPLIDHMLKMGYIYDHKNLLPPPYDTQYRSYSAYKMDTQWVRYTFYDPSKITKDWQRGYLSQVPKADGKNYCYYILDKVFSKTYIE